MCAKLISKSSTAGWKEYAYAGYWLYHQQHSQQIILLNSTGKYIFQQLEQGNSANEVIRKLMDKFQLTYALASHDVENCLTQWHTFHSVEQLHTASAISPQKTATDTGTQKNTTAGIGNLTTHYLQIAGKQFQLTLETEWLEKALLEIIGHLICTHTSARFIQLSVRQDSGYYQLSLNGHVINEVCGKGEVIAMVIYQLVEACYQGVDKPAVLHASAVADKQTAIIFAGSQGSGKSTLVAALQNHGFSYLADDVCPIIDNRLVPVPMSQVLKKGSWKPLNNYRPELNQKSPHRRLGRTVKYLPPTKTEAHIWDQRWPVSALVFPTYSKGAIPECKPLDPARALQELLRSGALISESIPETLVWLESTPAYSLEYANTAEAISAVQQISSISGRQKTKAPPPLNSLFTSNEANKYQKTAQLG